MLRGSQVTSKSLAFSFMMQPHFYFAFTCLCSLFFLCPALSTQCTETQFAWSAGEHQQCCNKCSPGTHLTDKSGCEVKCDPCIGERYMETYNLRYFCKICEDCNRTNMEYKLRCNATHNAVCRCKAGFECKDAHCKECVPIPSTTQPTFPPSTRVLKPVTLTSLTSLTTVWAPSKPLRDTVWFLVIIALLCAGITFIALTKIKPFLRWIRSKHGYLLAKTCAPVPPSSEDEEVSKPVQEAGSVTNFKTDPELGQVNISRVDL